MRIAAVLGVALVVVALVALLVGPRKIAGPVAPQQPLPEIAPAPEFTLTSQDGAPVSLADFRGRVVVVTFIYTLCTDTCPVLTPMMSFIQDRLGPDFGRKIAFVSITVDPERDTPAVLKEYALAFGADLRGWSFLTGAPEVIRQVTRRYGVFAAPAPEGAIDHSFLTSVVDPRGVLRVQYLGAHFDPEEFRRDLLSLASGR
jgi:protein SCO1/2